MAKLTDQQLVDIFWEIVGDPQDNEYDFAAFLDGLPSDATEADARAFAKLIKEISDESPYDE
jgi:hypothetical protein